MLVLCEVKVFINISLEIFVYEFLSKNLHFWLKPYIIILSIRFVRLFYYEYNHIMKNAGKAFINSTLLIEILAVFFIIILWAVIFHYVEWISIFDWIYFVISTMSTVWLWDITPKTELWKIFVIIYSFLGVPLFLSVSGLILESRFNRRIKSYISKFHKELHEAESELKVVEEKVNETLEDVLETTEETKYQVEEHEDRIDEVEEKVEDKIEKKSKRKTK